MNNYTTGAELNKYDIRDLSVKAGETILLDGRNIKSYRYQHIDRFAILDQKQQPACVGFAESLHKSIIDFEETGNIDLLSARHLYSLCKELDANNLAGTQPRVAGKVLADKGIANENIYPTDTTLSLENFIKLETSDLIKKAQEKSKITSYGFVNTLNVEDIISALITKKVLGITLIVSSNWGQVRIQKHNGWAGASLHRILLVGFKRLENGDVEFEFRNSWGTVFSQNGCQKFLWSEYKDGIFDVMSFIDAPNSVIEETKTKEFSYFWNRNLSKATNGIPYKEEIIALQKALLIKGFFYKEILGDQQPTGFFGQITETAVKKYQASKNLPQSGMFSYQTRTALNSEMAKKKI